MDHWPVLYTSPLSNLGSGFRILNDIDRFSRGAVGRRGDDRLSTFSPRFDIRENSTSYEIHGELPGIEKKNVHIEFRNSQTVVIKGRMETFYSSGALDDESHPPAAEATEIDEHKGHRHQALVQDEHEAQTGMTHTGKKPHAENAGADTKVQKRTDKYNYLLSERTEGEFSREFHLPQRVDPDGVSASLKDGVLTVEIPKAKKTESRRININ